MQTPYLKNLCSFRRCFALNALLISMGFLFTCLGCKHATSSIEQAMLPSTHSERVDEHTKIIYGQVSMTLSCTRGPPCSNVCDGHLVIEPFKRQFQEIQCIGSDWTPKQCKDIPQPESYCFAPNGDKMPSGAKGKFVVHLNTGKLLKWESME